MGNLDTSTMGARAKRVRLEQNLNQQQIAEALGVSLRAWQKLERDEGTPSGETLLQFEKLGINPGWILTGLGPRLMREDESYLYKKDAIIDPDLLLDIKEVVLRVHKDAGITLHQRDADLKAISSYNQYMADDTDLSDGEEIRIWLQLLEKRLKREVDAARAAPGTGKREAS